MRFFSFVFLLVFGLNVAAQSPTVSKLFADGTSHANAQRFEDALKSYKKALFVAENEYVGSSYLARLRYNIGVCHFRLERFDLAVNEFKHAILLQKDYVRAYYALGMAQTRKREWKAARASFSRVIDLNPTDGETWFDLAFAAIGQGDLEKAAEGFRKSIEFSSVDSALSYNNIGVILATKGDLAGAEKAFEKAIETSHDTLIQARRNLEFCRAKSEGRNFIALNVLEFTSRNVEVLS